MWRRNVSNGLLASLADTPCVFLLGPRQCGKTTLSKSIARDHANASYVTLDDLSALAAAKNDPAGFLRGYPGPVVLDEVQRAPELFMALKAAVDRDRTPGRFLLTGSANAMLFSNAAQELAGHMETLILWPLSQGELEGVEEGFLAQAFSGRIKATPPFSPPPLLDRIRSGGYPEVLLRAAGTRQAAWFDSYLSTILEREVRDLAQIERLAQMPRLLSLLGAQACGLLNFSEIARDFAIPQTTLKRYVALFEATFLVQLLPAWWTSTRKRLIKSPKLLLTDTGLLAHVLGEYANPERNIGKLLENFVAMELLKQATWSKFRVSLFHFRTLTGIEVDLVLENQAGHVVGVEVKTSATVSNADFKGLRVLAETAQHRFRGGIVLHTGDQTVSFGEKLWAVPVQALWESAV
ncbi:MAG: ATP-binding protein [Acidobacteria bacterium]|nr:ATP-binding protein [Acidobacteriota bacterium]